MLEFRLVYQGNLFSSGNKKPNSPHKQRIRRYFHRQLERLWKQHPALRSLSSWDQGPLVENRLSRRLTVNPDLGTPFLNRLAEEQKIGDKRIVPLVTESMHLNCSLDVLLLRRTKPHQLYSEGDLDGKIKTLLDALKKPGPNDNKDGDEDPLYCLMEDDKLLTELKLVGDLLLPAEDQLITVPEDTEEDSENPWKLKLGEQHAVVIIHVKVKVGRATEENTDFL